MPDASLSVFPESGPMNVGVWLPAETANVFRRHVPKKKRSEYGKEAIEQRLRREGAFDDKHREALAAIPPAALPLVSKLGELVEAVGPAAVGAKLDELVASQVATAAAGR